MKTLIIHPSDPTTQFLELTYRDIDATVITGGHWQFVSRLMERHDRIMMMGHGSPSGLFATGYRMMSPYLIDAGFAAQLRERDNNVFIWCYATQFMCKHRLAGFGTGMFISETSEARWMGVAATEAEVWESNYLFADVVGRFASQPLPVLKAAVDHEYGRLTGMNRAAKYNHSRMAFVSRARAAGDKSHPPFTRPVERPAPVF